MSNRPYSSTHRATIAFAISSCATSPIMYDAEPPASLIRCALRWAASSTISTINMLAPSSANRRAVPPPMPCAPPVTIPARPASGL